MLARASKQEFNIEGKVTSIQNGKSVVYDGERSKKHVFLSDKSNLVDLYDELKVELDGIVAEVEELGNPATRLSFEVNQEELRLFLKSRIKSSEDTPITDIETTHLFEFERFLDDLEKEVIYLENCFKKIQTDIEYYDEQSKIFSVRLHAFNSLSEERRKKLKIQRRQYTNTLVQVKKLAAQYKKLFVEVLNMVFDSNVEEAKSLMQDLWEALIDGDQYVDVTPKYQLLVGGLHLASLIKFHPHDHSKIKLYSD